MILQVIKHDLISILKRLSVFLVVYILIALMVAINLSLNLDEITIISWGLYIIFSVAIIFSIFLVTMLHFHKTMCSNNSYLTYSIPISHFQLVLAKLITSIFISLFISMVGYLAILTGIYYFEATYSLDLLWPFVSILQNPAILMYLLTISIGLLQLMVIIYFCMLITTVPKIKNTNYSRAIGVVAFVAINILLPYVPNFNMDITEKFYYNIAITSSYLYNILITVGTIVLFSYLIVTLIKKYRSI